MDSGEAAVPRIDVVDVIGKEPSRHNIPALDEALKELDGMIGVKKVKRALYSMVELARSNYRKQLRGERADEVSLNRLFLGNAGIYYAVSQVICNVQSLSGLMLLS